MLLYVTICVGAEFFLACKIWCLCGISAEAWHSKLRLKHRCGPGMPRAPLGALAHIAGLCDPPGPRLNHNVIFWFGARGYPGKHPAPVIPTFAFWGKGACWLGLVRFSSVGLAGEKKVKRVQEKRCACAIMRTHSACALAWDRAKSACSGHGVSCWM